MRVTFLGTGTSQGVPVIACDCEICASTDPRDKRLRSSVLVETQGKCIVVDTGPDFRQQMLRANVQQLDAVLFTHEHKDHVAGMDDIRAYNFKQKVDMPIYGSSNVENALRREYAYIFAEDKYPGVPAVEFNRIENQPFDVSGVAVLPILVYHYKLPVFGFRIGDFVYITDANRIPDEEKQKAQGAKVLVLNALRKEHHISHFSLNEAIDMARELGAETTYFTHISHLMGTHATVSKELPPGMHLAEDGLQVTC